jgi:hypothetical protein
MPDARRASLNDPRNHHADGAFATRKNEGENAMRTFSKACLIAAAALALVATGASAAIVCNDEGDCWHVKGKVEYKPEHGVHVHPDDWKWGEKEHFKWREHEGHGYWHSGTWIEIH